MKIHQNEEKGREVIEKFREAIRRENQEDHRENKDSGSWNAECRQVQTRKRREKSI